MSRKILVPFGIILIILGIATIAFPQRVHDQGGARRRYEDGELTDFGRPQQRGLGLFSVLLGIALFFLGLI